MPTGKRMAALLGGGSVGVLLVLGVAAVAMSTIQESSQPGAAPTIDSTVPTIEASMMTLVVNGYSIDQSRFSLPAGSPARISLEPPPDTTIPGGVQCELTVISTATGASASGSSPS